LAASPTFPPLAFIAFATSSSPRSLSSAFTSSLASANVASATRHRNAASSSAPAASALSRSSAPAETACGAASATRGDDDAETERLRSAVARASRAGGFAPEEAAGASPSWGWEDTIDTIDRGWVHVGERAR